jgi:nucleoside-diphosphate-sugar epimerase
LVTGASGYIGSLLTMKVLKAGHQLTVFDNRSQHIPLLDNYQTCNGVKIIKGDIRDNDTVCNAVAGVDTIIHLAAISDGNMGKLNPSLTREVNYDSLKNMIELAKDSGVNQFLFASTFGVYGKSYNQVLIESLKCNPDDSYSETKALCEQLLVEHNSNQFSTTSLRIAMVYGLAPTTRYEFLVNNMSLKAKTTRKLEIMGGLQRRPQIHVQDITDYFLKLLSIEKRLISGQLFNAVGQNPSIIEIAETIKTCIPGLEITILPPRPFEMSFEMDGEKLSKIGLKPAYTIKHGALEILENNL